MSLVITPAVDRWLYQTDAFTIVFRAYDDNGERCRNNQMAIKYSMTFDGSMPSLIDMETLYSDASGLIALVITKPCVISLYGSYARDISDPTKGMVTQEIAINYEITFQPVILNITAEYIGPDIPITNKYNGADLLITLEMSDGTIKTISPNECLITDYEIRNIGPNIKSFAYTDPLLGTVWTLSVTVNGIPKLLSLEAQYTGERKLMGDRIFPEEVIVHGIFLMSPDITERQEVEYDNWYFIDIPVITEGNNGIFRIGHQILETTISVPYDIVTSLRLNVWYEGAKIEVGKSYDPNNVVIYMVYPDGERKRISWKQCEIDSYLVTEEGWNWFTVTYITEFTKVKQEFPVEGTILKDYVDLDFKVLYITDLTSDRKEDQMDVTDEFQEELSFDGCLLIDWNQFLRVVNLSGRYGLYIVTVPKLSGMSNQYDMDWEVLCINENTLKANIKRIYKEEESHGNQEN